MVCEREGGGRSGGEGMRRGGAGRSGGWCGDLPGSMAAEGEGRCGQQAQIACWGGGEERSVVIETSSTTEAAHARRQGYLYWHSQYNVASCTERDGTGSVDGICSR